VRLLVASLVLVLLTACSGNDDDGGGFQPQETTAESGGSGDASAAAGGAVVAIGSETFEFDAFNAPGCVTIAGQVSGGADLDGGAVRLTFTIPPEDWETNENFNDPPSISITDGRTDPEVRWNAEVDSYSIDEGASGSATFVSASMAFSEDFVSETTSGTFDISCPG
jgi:hypothetical protein